MTALLTVILPTINIVVSLSCTLSSLCYRSIHASSYMGKDQITVTVQECDATNDPSVVIMPATKII
jgi:hypothetical protein